MQYPYMPCVRDRETGRDRPREARGCERGEAFFETGFSQQYTTVNFICFQFSPKKNRTVQPGA